MTIDHIMLKVKDWPKAKVYYEKVFRPLGYEKIVDQETWGGFGQAGHATGRIYVKQEEKPGRLHFAVSAPSPEAVKEAHKAAIEAGGKNNGDPGHRAHYTENGIGAFVIDLDDNNIEIVYQS